MGVSPHWTRSCGYDRRILKFTLYPNNRIRTITVKWSFTLMRNAQRILGIHASLRSSPTCLRSIFHPKGIVANRALCRQNRIALYGATRRELVGSQNPTPTVVRLTGFFSRYLLCLSDTMPGPLLPRTFSAGLSDVANADEKSGCDERKPTR